MIIVWWLQLRLLFALVSSVQLEYLFWAGIALGLLTLTWRRH